MAEPARLAAALAAGALAARFPDLPLVEPDTQRLSPADTRLAVAIHRHSLQRWLTIEAFLQGALRGPVAKLTPATRGVLLNAGAQLLFMDRLPAYAVIDAAAALARRLDQPRAAGLVNATLRKAAGFIEDRDAKPWSPDAQALPWLTTVSKEDPTPIFGSVHLSRRLLPKPDNLLTHLSVACSLPLALMQRWFKEFGREEATRLALQSMANPPTFVVENEAPRVWDAGHAELVDFLAADPQRRVQDPASIASVAAAADAKITPSRILDFCAGRGTKTRQLAALFPEANITAWDPDDARREDLHAVAASFPQVTVLDTAPASSDTHDLVVLDVPCSNTGVLARRPGARYRATADSRAGLVALQRTILAQGLQRTSSGGHVLYCTCSVDPEENQQQARWAMEQAGEGAALKSEAVLLPTASPTYHDGSYHALIALR
ncbi:MAG: transcription antitermination factor NusB [Algisphaera sp.]